MAQIFHQDCIDLTLTEKVQLVYADPPFFVQRDLGSFADFWPSIMDYVDYLTTRLKVCWNLLDKHGVMIVHLDWHAVHYIRVALDQAFGPERFLNEIIWKYNSGGASKRWLARKHDNLLVYVKGSDYTFNIHREPYATPNVQGRAGFHPDGRMLNDVWAIPFISTTAAERTGYATQKPLLLLERIISIFSNIGDTILDPFAGSGTTGAAAHGLQRNAIMCDTNREAVEVMMKRFASL